MHHQDSGLMGAVPGVAKTLVEALSGRFIKDMRPILSQGSRALYCIPTS
jgi:predicted acyltransferase